MLDIVRSKERYAMDAGWLQARWHFSFSQYYDPKHVQFGPLRVFNNDVIQPGKGFGMHPHSNMEILTYVLDGALEHKDSTGGQGVIHSGEVQRMSAGSGIMHSEFNASADEPVELVQIWVLPSRENVEPGYEQRRFTATERSGKLLPIASGRGETDGMEIVQDITMYVSRLEDGQGVEHSLEPGRKAYVFVADGAVELNGQSLWRGDSVKVDGNTKLAFAQGDNAELVLLDLP